VTDECRPAAGAEHHWFKHNDHGYRLYERISGTALGTFWMYRDFGGKSETLAAEGWTYHLPASPDDATERARLEGENKRLRGITEAAAALCAQISKTREGKYAGTDAYLKLLEDTVDAEDALIAALTPGATP
jgi:hypothetical protein